MSLNRTSHVGHTSGAVPWQNRAAVLNGEHAYTGLNPITTALSNAVSGDTITVGPGTYTENLSGFPSSLSLIGPGGRGSAIIDGESSGRAVTVDNDDVTIRGFECKTDEASSEHAVEVASSVVNPVLENLWITEAGLRAIWFDASGGSPRSGKVSRINIERAGSDGIRIDGERHQIDMVHIIDGGGSIQGVGFDVQGTNHVISNLFVQNPDSHGIQIKGSDSVLDAFRIVDAGDVGLRITGDDIQVGTGRITGSTTQPIGDENATRPEYANVKTDDNLVLRSEDLTGLRM